MDVSNITLPNGNTVNIKDSQARESISNINKKIEDINSKIDDYHRSRKILVIGDSYGNERTSDGKNYIDIAKELSGITTEYLTKNGAGFTNVNGQGTFLQLLQTYNGNKASITDIYVLGGCNDYDTTENTLNAIKSFMNYVRSNYKANVFIGHIGNFNDNQSNRRTRVIYTSLPAYRNCGFHNAIYIKNSEYIMFNRNDFKADNVHPNESGVNKLGRYVAQAFTNGFCDVTVCSPQNPTSIIADDVDFSVRYAVAPITYQHNDYIAAKGMFLIVAIFTSGITGLFESPIFKNFIPLGWGSYANNCAVPVNCECTLLSGKKKFFIGSIRIDSDNNLAIRLQLDNETYKRIDVYTMSNFESNADMLR